MAILITGGTGFIGHSVINEFRSAGYEVLVFDYSEPNENIKRKWDDKVSFMRGDIRDRDLTRSLMKRTGGDPVVHLAGILTAGCDRDPDTALSVNVHGTHNILEAAREFENRRVVIASTIGVYGPGLPQPIEESMPTEPDGWYGLTKLMAEHMGLLYVRRYGMDFRALRFAAVTGPGRSAGSGSASLFTSFIPEKAAIGEPYEIEVDEDSAYPVVYIKDAVKALFTITTASSAPRRIYNISSGRVVTSELVALVKKRISSADFSYKPDPLVMAVVKGYKNWKISCRRAEEDLGWRPVYTVERMVKDIIDIAQGG